MPNISVHRFKSEISKGQVVSCGRYARIFPLLNSSVIRVILLFPQIIGHILDITECFRRQRSSPIVEYISDV